MGILDKDLSYAHWERRLRGYLNGDEQWSIVPAEEERVFYCLKEEEQKSTCGAQLRGIIDDSHWSYADRKSSFFSKLSETQLVANFSPNVEIDHVDISTEFLKT